jgi:hypothetical protein
LIPDPGNLLDRSQSSITTPQSSPDKWNNRVLSSNRKKISKISKRAVGCHTESVWNKQ